MSDRPRSDEDAFTELFQRLSPAVLAYARRQVDEGSAQDVVADTFLIAWRRFDELPDDPLPWLMVVARNTASDRRRRGMRQSRLTDTIAQLDRAAGHGTGADDEVIERDTLLTALGGLSDTDREALLLVSWDGLSNSAAAQVARCSVRAFEVRLSRARARLNRAVQSADEPLAAMSLVHRGAATGAVSPKAIS